jgi:hypothetical protein
MSQKSKTPALWTPLYEPALIKYGLLGAAVFGEIWRYCQMGKRMCVASRSTIASNLGLTIRTVDKYLGLLSSGAFPYIKDLTPEVKNRPHAYIDTGQCRVDSEQGMQIVHSGEQEMPTDDPEIPLDGVQDIPPTVQEMHPGVQLFPERGANLALEESIKKGTKETNQESFTPLSLGDTPPPLARPPPITAEQLKHPDPELGRIWQECCLPDLRPQFSGNGFDDNISRLVPICIEDGWVVLAGPDHVTARCKQKPKIPIQRTLAAMLSIELGIQIEGVSFVDVPPGGT